MGDHLNHAQTSTLGAAGIPSCSTLLELPEVRKGMRFGRTLYYDLEYKGILTEEEMLTLVEDELSRHARRQEAYHAHLTDDAPLPFLLHLGVVLGVLDEALGAQAQ